MQLPDLGFAELCDLLQTGAAGSGKGPPGWGGQLYRQIAFLSIMLFNLHG
jgi:hypothetical protein